MNIQQIDLQAFVDNLEQAYTIVKQQIVICKAIKDLITNNNVVETDLTAMQALDNQVNTIKINVTKLQNDVSETMIAVAQHTEQINQLTNDVSIVSADYANLSQQVIALEGRIDTLEEDMSMVLSDYTTKAEYESLVRVTPTDVIADRAIDDNYVPSFNVKLLHDGLVLSNTDIIAPIKDLLRIDVDFSIPNISTTFPSDFNNPTACIATHDLSNNDAFRGLIIGYINNYYPVFSSSILLTIMLDCNISGTTDRIITFNKIPFALSVMTINDKPIYCFKATSNIDLDNYGWTPDHMEKFDFIIEYNTFYNSILLYVNLTTYAVI